MVSPPRSMRARSNWESSCWRTRLRKAGAISFSPLPEGEGVGVRGFRQCFCRFLFRKKSQGLHDVDGFASTLEGGLGRIQRIQAGRLTDGGQDRGFGRRQRIGGFAEIELGGGIRTVGIVAVIGRIEIPLDHLRTSIFVRDLGGQQTLADGALEGERLVP